MQAYEQVKALTRGCTVTREGLHAFIAGLDVPADDKARLLQLTPATYTAGQLVRFAEPNRTLTREDAYSR